MKKIITKSVKEIKRLTRQIDTVHCGFEYTDNQYYFLLDGDTIHKQLTAETLDLIKKYGINCKEMPLGERGGGLDTFFEALKLGWQHGGIIEAIASGFGHIIYISKRYFQGYAASVKPGLTLYLGLQSESLQDDDVVHSGGYKLVTLKLLADEICEFLFKKYPLFNFSQTLSLTYQPQKISINCSIPFKKRTDFNNYRIIKILNNIKIRPNKYYDISFMKFFFINRNEAEFKVDENSWVRGKGKNFYLLFSSKILRDYFINRET